MTGRPDEEHARSCFDEYLSANLPTAQIDWETVDQGHDPPDYWLIVENVRYAVEVTSLVAQYERSGKKPLSEIAVLAMIRWIEKRIDEVSRMKGILRGFYVLDFAGPYDQLGATQTGIVDAALAIVATTQEEESTEVLPVRVAGGPRCTIQKMHAKKSVITCPCVSDAGGWEGDVRQEIRALIEERVQKKVDALRHIPEPKILLLLDRYYFAEVDDLPQDIESIKGVRHFRSIYHVRQDAVHRLWPCGEEHRAT